jgi:hypothetical protein
VRLDDLATARLPALYQPGQVAEPMFPQLHAQVVLA